MKNLLKKWKKWLIAMGFIGVVSASVVFSQTVLTQQSIGAIPCIDDNTKGINERIVNCPITDIKQKANFKGREIAKLVSIPKVLHGKYEIEIMGLNPIEGGVEFYVRAWEGGVPVGLGVGKKFEKEHFRVFNPPILVDDPNGTITRTLGKTEVDGTVMLTARPMREDLREALLQVVEHGIKVTGKKGVAILGSIGNTTDTFFPDPTIPSTAVDGKARRLTGALGTGEAWATIRAGAGTESARDSGNVEANVLADNVSNKWRIISRMAFDFDTSSIADTDTIDSGTFSLFGNSSTDTLSPAASISMIDNNLASVTAIAASDYYLNSNLLGGVNTLQATDITIASWSNTGYNDFTLNATGKGNVSKTGITKFGAVINSDQSNTEPTWSSTNRSEVNVYASDNAGTAKDPQLVVVHSAAAGAIPPRTERIQIFFNYLSHLALVK